jgi:ankyrin repeat protein
LASPDISEVCNLPLVDERLPALHVAAKLGYHDVLSDLLRFCRINQVDVDGYTALHHSAMKGHPESARRLLDAKGVKLDSLSRAERITPLWLASSYGHKEVVSCLVDKGADMEIKSAHTLQTALSQAARNGHRTVVELLVEEGANPHCEDINSHTPLHWATKMGRQEIVNLLTRENSLKRGNLLGLHHFVGQRASHQKRCTNEYF